MSYWNRNERKEDRIEMQKLKLIKIELKQMTMADYDSYYGKFAMNC